MQTIRALLLFLPLFAIALFLLTGGIEVIKIWLADSRAGQIAFQAQLFRFGFSLAALLSSRYSFPLGLLAGGLVFLAQAVLKEQEWRHWLFLSLPSLAPPLAWLGASLLVDLAGQTPPPPQMLYPWLWGVGMGILAALAWLRWGTQRGEALRLFFSRRSQLERNRKTDVREIEKLLPREIGRFDPTRFFKPQKGLFAGLDEQRRPIYIPTEDWQLSHLLLSGRTRSGKGVAAQILLSQAISRGEFVIVLDPKNDEWMPHVFFEASRKAGQPYHFLDLRPGRPPQINPFNGADEETVEAMLIGGFSLSEKGEAADFYRLADRRAAREAAELIAQHGMTAREALAERGSDWAEHAAGFHAALEEMAGLTAVNSPAGLDLEELARTGGCLYVVGDMGNTRVIRQQRMLLIRLMMMAKKLQSQNASRRLMTVFADEFKVHISRPFMTGLGAAAGWGVHFILAFQSLQDLADVPFDLDKDAVRGAVMENCAIQLSYRIKDPETAEWLAASTGKILVDDEIRKVQRNLALAETVDPSRQIRLAERFYIDENMFMNMPKGCGVLSLPTGLPKFCYTSPVAVEKNPQAVAISVSDHTTSREPPVTKIADDPQVQAEACDRQCAGGSQNPAKDLEREVFL